MPIWLTSNIFVMLPISCGKIRWFAQPIQALLHAAYANASLYALRSAAHKLLNYAQQAREYWIFVRTG